MATTIGLKRTLPRSELRFDHVFNFIDLTHSSETPKENNAKRQKVGRSFLPCSPMLLNLPPAGSFDSLALPLNKKSQKPATLRDLLLKISFSVQDEACSQMENLLVNQANMLSSLKLPVKRKEFVKISCEEKSALVPKWIELDEVRYIHDTQREVHFGGYGAVAFFLKQHLSSANLSPKAVALKIGDVPVADLKELIDLQYDTSSTKSHWVREFCVQMRLKRSFPFNYNLPFADIYGASLVKVGRSVEAFTAMEAGQCDLFQLFTSQPLSEEKTNVCTLITAMRTAAESLDRLHSVGLHHGDVKLANILLNFSGQRAIFMDFDGSVFNDEDTTCDTFTQEYISPQRNEDDEKYSREADDNWALGISFLIGTTLKKSPLENLSVSAVQNFNLGFHLKLHFLDLRVPQKTKRLLEEVICGLLQPEEKDRMSAREAADRLSSFDGLYATI